MGIRALQAGALTDALDREVPEDCGGRRDYQRSAPFRVLARELGESPASLAHRYALSMAGVATVVLRVKIAPVVVPGEKPAGSWARAHGPHRRGSGTGPRRHAPQCQEPLCSMTAGSRGTPSGYPASLAPKRRGPVEPLGPGWR